MEIDVTYKITASFTMREWSLILTALDKLQQTTAHPMHAEAAEMWDDMVNRGPAALPLYRCHKDGCKFTLYVDQYTAMGQTQAILAHHRSVHGEEDA